MGIRTGAQYIEAVKARKPEVWLSGKKVDNLFEEPVFKQPILEIAKLYDMRHDPEFQDKITHVCEETGERVNNAFLVPKSYEDLVKRRNVFEAFAKATFGLMGRTPDFLNVVVTSMYYNSWFFEKYNKNWAENVRNYYKYMRDNDIFLTHAIINPQNDRKEEFT